MSFVHSSIHLVWWPRFIKWWFVLLNFIGYMWTTTHKEERYTYLQQQTSVATVRALHVGHSSRAETKHGGASGSLADWNRRVWVRHEPNFYKEILIFFCLNTLVFKSSLTSRLLHLSVSVSVSVSLRLLRSISLTGILLHLLDRALLHWTLLWFPLKYTDSFKWVLCNIARSVQIICPIQLKGG